MKMWKDKLQEIIHEEFLCGYEINNGVTQKAIELFIKEIKNELNMDLPSDYTKFLEIVNGLEFNGFILYGIDQRLLDRKYVKPINGLIEYNKIWYENEWQKQYIFLGESSISWYAYDLITCKYYELDNPSGREIEVFNNLDCLMEKILSDALE